MDFLVEWPTTTFQTINPHITLDYSPQKMYQVFHHESHIPSSKPKRDASVGNTFGSPEALCRSRFEKKFKYLQGGYPKMELKYPNIDSVKPILNSSANKSFGKKRELEKCLHSLEKTRINEQIQRDEANCINFLHHKIV